MTRTSRITVTVVLAAIALLFLGRLRYPGKPTLKLSADQCDASLWDHVYEKDRLHVIETCTSVEGRVIDLHPSKDGDLHIALDPDEPSILNIVNLVHGRGRLVVEVICDHLPGRREAQLPCANFHSQITLPHNGDHVRITGAYVTDNDNGWNEIHPVTRIEILH